MGPRSEHVVLRLEEEPLQPEPLSQEVVEAVEERASLMSQLADLGYLSEEQEAEIWQWADGALGPPDAEAR